MQPKRTPSQHHRHSTRSDPVSITGGVWSEAPSHGPEARSWSRRRATFIGVVSVSLPSHLVLYASVFAQQLISTFCMYWFSIANPDQLMAAKDAKLETTRCREVELGTRTVYVGDVVTLAWERDSEVCTSEVRDELESPLGLVQALWETSGGVILFYRPTRLRLHGTT